MPDTFNEWMNLAFFVIVGLVLLGVLVWLGAGLFQARSLIRRELAAYFLSPIAYVVLAVFLLITGARFYLTLDKLTATGTRGVEYPMSYMFSIFPQTFERSLTALGTLDTFSAYAFWLLFLLIPAVLTMRLFAEERSAGTLETLMTAPLRDWQVVMSKYLACFLFYVILWVPTLLYLPILLEVQAPIFEPVWTLFSILMVGGAVAIVLALILAYLPGGDVMRVIALFLGLLGLLALGVGAGGHYIGYQFGETVYGGPEEPGLLLLIPTALDPMPVVSTYLGLILLGGMFLALGILVSSLVRSQLVAALVAVVVNMAFILVGLFGALVPEMGQRLVSYFNVPLHISRDFGRGIIDTRHIVLYASVAVFALFLTVRSLESRRWR